MATAALNTQQHMLIEQRIANDRKSTGTAYLLWFFLSGFGAHRFYLGRTGTGICQLLLFIAGIVTLIPLIPLGIWVLVDAFLIPGMIRQDTDNRRVQLAQEYSVLRLAD